jgi:hypothetical protein
MLNAVAVATFQPAAAASLGEIKERYAGDYRLLLIPEGAKEASRIYLLIELPTHLPVPSRLFAEAAGREIEIVDLPKPYRQRFQLLLDEDAPLVAIIRDPDARIWLR